MLVRLLSPAYFLLLYSVLLTTSVALAATPSKTVPVQGKPKPAVTQPKPQAQTPPKPEPVLKDFTFRGNRIGDPAETVIYRSVTSM